MNNATQSYLSRSERLLLRVGSFVVPQDDRLDWTRTWQAELWHLHHRRPGSSVTGTASHLTFGLILDALWLRGEFWRRALPGTATLCLLSLVAACLFATSAGYLLTGGFEVFYAHTVLFLVEAPLVLFVTFTTTSRRHVHDGTAPHLLQRLQRQIFFAVKTILVLTLCFVISVDLVQPTRTLLPLASDIVQTLLFVIFAITGLRWAILDQQRRCKHCLLALALPSRVGRPSHNLLEWNGTQQICRKGHGVLSSPELESSWCSHSRWLGQEKDQCITV